VRRDRALAIGVAAIVAASLVGWFAGRQIRSPAEIAARTAAPARSVISVPVERQRLTSDVVVRGTVRYGQPQPVTLPTSALKPVTGIVTSLPATGATLDGGSVALTVSGRPVIVLQGTQPSSRDLAPGTEGLDVAQLESALAWLGFDPGAVDGRYDRRTADAVARWYRSLGYEPFGPTDEQQTTLRGTQAEEFTARSEHLNAQEALTTAGAAQAAAAADVVAKEAAFTEVVGAGGTTLEIATAYAELSAARTAAAEAVAATDIARRRVSLSAGRERAVSGEVGSTAAKQGVTVPADEVLFFPTLPLRVDDVTVNNGEEATVPVMTVSSSRLMVEAALTPADARLVRDGADVAIEEPELGIRLTGTVTDLATEPGTQGVDPGRFYLAVTPTSAPGSLAGSSVVLTVRARSSEGRVLVVPVAALSVAADGSSRVQVDRRGRPPRFVTVRPGLAAKGLVAVTPLRGRLAPGDLVVVGRTAGGSVSSSGRVTGGSP
jgi:peptidoglycan hydrolase-like protein with peptidoglycan-binding domain